MRKDAKGIVQNLGAEKDRLGKCQLAQHMEAFSLCHKEAKKPEHLIQDVLYNLMKDLMTEDSTLGTVFPRKEARASISYRGLFVVKIQHVNKKTGRTGIRTES